MIDLHEHRGRSAPLRALFLALRPAHWAKNGLLAAPALLAQLPWTGELVFKLVLGMVLASACASAGYLVNDVLDRGADRTHPVKCARPIASGALPVRSALGMAAALAAAALATAWLALGPLVGALLALYLASTVLYSLAVKRLIAVDVLLLAGLYMLRLEIGAEIAGVAISGWLLAFGFTLFTALALLKRLDELAIVKANGTPVVSRRAYGAEHGRIVERVAIGLMAAAMALLAGYVVAAAWHYYSAPAWLWLAVFLFGTWLALISRHARRGQLRADPVAFAITDPLSLALAAGVLAALLLAR